MYNQKKLKFVKCFVLGLIAIALFTLGIGTGSLIPHKSKTITANKSTAVKSLTEKEVNDFLVVYYTRKDLGENQNRFKQYMTESMFTQEMNNEAAPAQASLKGTAINQVFDGATIYVDTKNNTAIADVKYKYDAVADPSNPKAKKLPTSGNVQIRISFTEVSGKLLVNRLDFVTLTTPDNLGTAGSGTENGDVDTPPSSSEVPSPESTIPESSIPMSTSTTGEN